MPNGNQKVRCEYGDRGSVEAAIKKYSEGESTSTSNDERIGVSLVKGIHAEYEPKEILEQLEEKVDFKIKNIRRFQRKIGKGDKKLHWWVVTTETRELCMRGLH